MFIRIPASQELHTAFSDFTSTRSLFALPVTIAGESLQPLEAVPWTNNDFDASLQSLAPHLQPKTPIYLLVRTEGDGDGLVAIMYVPSTAAVRAKMLFASTRATLVRELGLEKFSSELFVTDPEEVLESEQWVARKRRQDGGVDVDLLSAEERELQSVKRAEEEERHGTQGRDLMGEGGSGVGYLGKREGSGAARNGISMKITDEAKDAIAKLAQSQDENSPAILVQFGIDIASETLILLASESDITPEQVSTKIPASHPSYTFYHYPSTDSTLFLYVCPGSSKIKERMMYAASRLSVVENAKAEGIRVAKTLEAGEPDDMSASRLGEEIAPKSTAEESSSTRQGFARPKRPGRR